QLANRKGRLHEQIENPKAGPKDETPADRTARIESAKQDLQELSEEIRSTKEEFKEKREALEKQFQDIRTLKSALLPFNVPLGKVDIAVSYSPLLWIFLFTFFLAYFFYRRLALVAALSKVVHLQVDMRNKRIEDLRGLGSGAPFWMAPLPTSLLDSHVSLDDLRQYL